MCTYMYILYIYLSQRLVFFKTLPHERAGVDLFYGKRASERSYVRFIGAPPGRTNGQQEKAFVSRRGKPANAHTHIYVCYPVIGCCGVESKRVSVPGSLHLSLSLAFLHREVSVMAKRRVYI